ncbi:MAG: hypothetical protein ACREIV_00035 [Planctomycetaceae bacterium]
MAKPLQAATRKTLSGLFSASDAAESAYRACVDLGYEIGDVNVIVPEGRRQEFLTSASEVKTELGKKKAEGGELGGPTGGRTGLLVTIFAAVGAAVAIPTIGIVAGPIAVALTAAGAAGAAAGLISLLGDWGVPEDRVRHYENAIRKGAILITVAVRSDADARRLEVEWKKLGGREIHYG